MSGIRHGHNNLAYVICGHHAGASQIQTFLVHNSPCCLSVLLYLRQLDSQRRKPNYASMLLCTQG